MPTNFLKKALMAAVVALPLAGTAKAGPVAPAPIVPFAATGDLFVQVDSLDGIARVNPTTGAASLFISDAQVQAALTAAGDSGSNSFSETNLAFDLAGNLYFTSVGNDSVFKRTAAGQLSALATGAQLEAISPGFDSGGIAFGDDGLLYVVDRNTPGAVFRIDPMTGAATVFRSAAQILATPGINDLNLDSGIVGLPNGKIYFTNEGGNPRGIIEVDLGTGTVAITAGNADPNIRDPFGQPTSLTRGPNGDLFLGDKNGNVYRVTPAGVVTLFIAESAITAVTGETPGRPIGGIAFDDSGSIYLGDSFSASLLKFAVADPTTNPVAGAGMILTPETALDALDSGGVSLSGGIAFAPGNVTISDVTFIPEPGTLALFGLGLAGLGFARRRKMV